jgi:hypothetical protein
MPVRKTLIIIAVVNAFASLAIVFMLSMFQGGCWMWIVDHAARMEQANAIDYDRLGADMHADGRRAVRGDLEQAMGIGNTKFFGYAAKALLLLTVVQTGAMVTCALRMRGGRPPSPPQPTAPTGDIPNG